MKLKCLATGSKGNCYILENNGEILILDFGIPWKKILKGINFKISSVVSALLTHEHKDHSYAYLDLFRNGIPIYTNDETEANFEAISGEKMTGCMEKKTFKIGSFTVIPFYLPHNSLSSETGELIPCYNFGWLISASSGSNGSIERLLYATDFEYVPYSFAKMKIDHFLVECNHDYQEMDTGETKYEHSIRGHCSLTTCKEFLRVNKTDRMKNVILCHPSLDGLDWDMAVKEVKETVGDAVNVSMATKGEEYTL